MVINVLLLEKIEGAHLGLLATILKTEGHTYKKVGEKALYEVGDPLPVCGNIGAGCVDQEILLEGAGALEERRPRIVRVDTTDPSDIVFGSGTFCGGVMEVLLEPLFDGQKAVYRDLRGRLERKVWSDGPEYLVHYLEDGSLGLSTDEPDAADGIFVEAISPPRNLVIFGATPLARQVVGFTEEMDFMVRVADWRGSYLKKFEGIRHVRSGGELGELDKGSFVLVMSHNYERDREALRSALSAECAFVGLLSSRTRRDRMFEELKGEGIPRLELERVSSPVGVDIGARTDPEIALSIVAELVWRKRDLEGV
jgi:xanthine dehydrogenase accessory factor